MCINKSRAEHVADVFVTSRPPRQRREGVCERAQNSLERDLTANSLEWVLDLKTAFVDILWHNTTVHQMYHSYMYIKACFGLTE